VFPAEHRKQLADSGLAGLERDAGVNAISVPRTDPFLGDVAVSFSRPYQIRMPVMGKIFLVFIF
jgi:hypothetical protein